jgi:hypothetical protein
MWLTFKPRQSAVTNDLIKRVGGREREATPKPVEYTARPATPRGRTLATLL